MYLITIAMAVEDGITPPISVPHIADALGLSPVSANEMVKKLDARGLIKYIPYKGVVLEPVGAAVAEGLLRRRRLWSVFLSEKLGLNPSSADTVACEFEHVTPEDVVERLASFLGDPAVGAQGKRIPTVSGRSLNTVIEVPLGSVAVGLGCKVVGISADGDDQAFLNDHGLVPGVTVTVLASAEGGAVLVSTPTQRVNLAGPIAELVSVIPS